MKIISGILALALIGLVSSTTTFNLTLEDVNLFTIIATDGQPLQVKQNMGQIRDILSIQAVWFSPSGGDSYCLLFSHDTSFCPEDVSKNESFN
jgi:hypothetical protein